MEKKKTALAYIVGVALGDGNLSNPNKRALRLRISCDARYTHILSEIQDNLRIILPKNKVSLIRVPGKPNIVHVSIYSNKLSSLMPWKCGHGPKYAQQARVPNWILSDTTYRIACLRGLLQTDGSIYMDRKYRMVNFTNETKELADDVSNIFKKLGFHPTMSIAADKNRPKYTVRLARNAERFIELIGLSKT